jgi:hypothetical protein
VETAVLLLARLEHNISTARALIAIIGLWTGMHFTAQSIQLQIQHFQMDGLSATRKRSNFEKQ